nr:DoxX family protein [Muribaculum intestinale]
MHGLYKINDFDQMALTFPDPLGIGSELSLILAIFGEAFCSMMLILRLLTRLSLIPMMFTMCIAFLGGFMLEAHFQQKSDPLFIWQSLL